MARVLPEKKSLRFPLFFISFVAAGFLNEKRLPGVAPAVVMLSTPRKLNRRAGPVTPATPRSPSLAAKAESLDDAAEKKERR